MYTNKKLNQRSREALEFQARLQLKLQASRAGHTPTEK